MDRFILCKLKLESNFVRQFNIPRRYKEKGHYFAVLYAIYRLSVFYSAVKSTYNIHTTYARKWDYPFRTFGDEISPLTCTIFFLFSIACHEQITDKLNLFTCKYWFFFSLRHSVALIWNLKHYTEHIILFIA